MTKTLVFPYKRYPSFNCEVSLEELTRVANTAFGKYLGTQSITYHMDGNLRVDVYNKQLVIHLEIMYAHYPDQYYTIASLQYHIKSREFLHSSQEKEVEQIFKRAILAMTLVGE